MEDKRREIAHAYLREKIFTRAALANCELYSHFGSEAAHSTWRVKNTDCAVSEKYVTQHADQKIPAMAQVTNFGKAGAQLWAEKCVRCHNIRSPSSYSDAQWEVAILHMRLRAKLTAEEQRKTLEFMKSAK